MPRSSAPASHRSPPELAFRPAREGDLERLVAVHTSAYPDPRGHDARVRNFVANPLGALEDLRVAEERGTIVGHAFLFPLAATFGGVSVAVGGIASVAVAPEARGRGVGSALLFHLHEEAHARGDASTLLFPYRQGFYARHGYALVSPFQRLSLHAGSLPRSFSEEPEVTIRPATGADREALEATYARAAQRSTGWLSRPREFWERLLLDERRVWLVAARAGSPCGYVTWSLFTPAQALRPVRLAVHELLADDAAARRALLGAVGAQRDQVDHVSLSLDREDPLAHALLDADRAHAMPEATFDPEDHPLGRLVSGPMVRVTAPVRALEARGYAGEGTLTLAIEGVPAGGAPERITMNVRGARATVRCDMDPSGPVDLHLDRSTLGAVAFGALAPSEAARLGLLEAAPEALRLADRIFELPPFFMVDTF